MEQNAITQEKLDGIIKKNSAKYLKKLEEKEAEIKMLKEALDNATTKQEAPLTDEEVIRVVEEILNTPKAQRSEEDEKTLLDMKEHYGHALFKADMAELSAWAKENFDGNINELVAGKEFLDFVSDINGRVTDLAKKYVKLTKGKSRAEAKTPGSAKDTTGVVSKEYFSKEEVLKMTPAEVKKYMPVIEKSMSKWH